MSNEYFMMTRVTFGVTKNTWLYKMSYFPEAYTRTINKTNVELDLSIYETKSN